MFTLEIHTDNSAFDTQENAAREVARILNEVALKLSNQLEGDLRDINGNKCGSFEFDENSTDEWKE